MSGAEHEKPDSKGEGKPRRRSSSLTDAVVAALATVEGESSADGPAEEGPEKSPAREGPAGKGLAEQDAAPAAAEAGCAPTEQAAQALPAPSVVGADPAPPDEGTNGFRTGPGSFAELTHSGSATAASDGTNPSQGDAPEQAESTPEPASATAGGAEPVADSAHSEPPADPPASTDPSADAPRSSSEPSGWVQVEYFGRTDVGLVREHNEDNFLVADLTEGVRDAGAPRRTSVRERGCIFAVCDGMGGAAAGEVASQMAVDTIYEVLDAGGAAEDRDEFARRLVRAIEEAGHRIFSAAKMDRTRRGMGTTATLAGLVDDVLFVGQVGDSRAYVLRGDQLEMITKDQSLVNQLIEAGQLTEEEADAFEHSNIILQALGTTEEVTVDLTFLQLRKGDRLMICSDGLSGLVHSEMIREVMRDCRELTEAADKLIQMANAGGGHDNITVILADFDGEGLQPPEDARVLYQQYPLPPEDTVRTKSLPPRETSIKEGGPKPGADVKRDGEASASVEEVAVPRPSSSKGWVFVLLVAGLLALLLGGYLVMNAGLWSAARDTPPSPEAATEQPDVVPLEPPTAALDDEASASEAVPTTAAHITVETDVEGGTLLVNDRVHGPLSDGMVLELAPGAYTLQARQGETSVAEAEPVSVSAGQSVTVDLNMPPGAGDGPVVDEPPEQGLLDESTGSPSEVSVEPVEPVEAAVEPSPAAPSSGPRSTARQHRTVRGRATGPDGLPSNPF